MPGKQDATTDSLKCSVKIGAALIIFLCLHAGAPSLLSADEAATTEEPTTVLRTGEQSPDQPAATLIITAKGFESDDGQSLIKIYNSDDGFPKDNEKAFRLLKSPINRQTFTLTLNDLPPGEYAILVLHDENNNGEMDTNWIGMPDEPLGISNYPKPGRPSFDKAKVKISGGKIHSVEVAVAEI